MSFVTRERSAAADVMAPDGSEVRILAASSRGSMAQFTLPPGAVSKPVAHRTVEEVWLVIGGPAVVVVAGIVTAVIAYKGADPVVTARPGAVAAKVGR